MLYAKWNNKVIDAESVAETEVSETLVRKVSGIELLCVDPHCDYPLVGYKHGHSCRPHFFHLVNGNCDYAAFERTDNSLVREARNSLYHHFRDIGYNVEREQKLPDGKKYCHLLFHIDKRDITRDGTRIAAIYVKQSA